MLSVGCPSTLENWIKLSSAVFGQESAPVKYLLQKVEESPNRLDEEVIADERQLIYFLMQMFVDEKENGQE